MSHALPTMRSQPLQERKRAITRHRISYSCQVCHRRKLKCDKQRPSCGRCRQANEDCIYLVGDDGAPIDSDTSRDDVQQNIPQKRKAQFDSDLPATSVASITTGLNEIEQRISLMTDLVNNLEQAWTASSEYTAPITIEAKQADHSQANNPSASSNQATAALQVEQNSDCEQRSDHVTIYSPNGAALWDKTLAKLDRLVKLLKSFGNSPLAKTSPSSDPSARGQNAESSAQSVHLSKKSFIANVKGSAISAKRSRRKLEQESSIMDMVAPPEEDSHVLLRCWLTSVYCVFPLISLSLVLSKYHAFWKWHRNGLDRGIPNPDKSFMPLLHAIWYGGTASMSAVAFEQRVSWTTRTSCLHQTRKRFEDSLEMCNYPSEASILPLVASVMMQSMLIHQEDPTYSNIKCATLIRSAQRQRMHTEHPMRSISTVDVEMKRRIWWEVVNVDVSLAMTSGLPPLSDEATFDTKMCEGTEDERKDFLSATKPLQDPNLKSRNHLPDDGSTYQSDSTINFCRSVMKARHLMAKTTLQISKMNFRTHDVSLDNFKQQWDMIDLAVREVNAIVSRIPARDVPEQGLPVDRSDHAMPEDCTNALEQPLSESEIEYLEIHDWSGMTGSPQLTMFYRRSMQAFHKWARITLSMMTDRLYCILYAPYLQDPKNKLWDLGRSCALRHCHDFMRKFNYLASDEELARFRWSWPGMFQPMHATLIILVDLNERPYTAEAVCSRALIDEMFSLSAVEIGIVRGANGATTAIPLYEGGEATWATLWKLRDRAWRRAGLDPKVVWTESDQTGLGIGRSKPGTMETFPCQSGYNLSKSSTNEKESALPTNGNGATVGITAMNVFDEAENTRISEETFGSNDRSGIMQFELLRASNAQRPMPHPLETTLTMDQTSDPQPGDGQTSDRPDSSNMLHLGQLLRKIRGLKNRASDEKPSDPLAAVDDGSSEPVPDLDEEFSAAGSERVDTVRSNQSDQETNLSDKTTLNVTQEVPDGSREVNHPHQRLDGFGPMPEFDWDAFDRVFAHSAGAGDIIDH